MKGILNMKIAICNGSPKGNDSITLQYALFIMKTIPGAEYEVYNIAAEISRLERDPEYFSQVMSSLSDADVILWSFGLWVLSVPAQLMRFFELIEERCCTEMFAQRYAAILSTSIHYFDHTAHEYMRAVCEDMGMRIVDHISLHMKDISDPEKRAMLHTFGENIQHGIESGICLPGEFPHLPHSNFTYTPSEPVHKIGTEGKKILILADRRNAGSNLEGMVSRFQACFVDEPELLYLEDIDIKGGCRGCMACGYDYTCVYRDGFTEFYNSKVREADIIVHAGEMKGRYLSSLWKTFFDRAFFWNHTPSLQGKQLGYIISGPVSHNRTLVQVLEAHASARQHANHAGIISDETGDSHRIDGDINSFAYRLVHYAHKSYVRPGDFLGAGGWKIFRDEIYSGIRMVWQADHRYYKKHGYYDFPNRNILMNLALGLLGLMLKVPRFRKRFYGKLKTMPAERTGKTAQMHTYQSVD